MNTQRSAYTRGDLSAERIEKLEAVDGWVWDAVAEAWAEGYQALCAYVDEHGHARVPDSFRTPEGYQLGMWVNSQRSANTKGDLSPERIEKLEAVTGWVWDARKGSAT